jgi:exodeoxyribonuclease VII small subunit
MTSKPTKRKDAPAESEGFDAVMTKLRAVVERLETGDLPLEASMAAYEEGVALARRGHGLLDAAEQRVELLRQASDAPEPLAPDDDDDDDGRR